MGCCGPRGEGGETPFDRCPAHWDPCGWYDGGRNEWLGDKGALRRAWCVLGILEGLGPELAAEQAEEAVAPVGLGPERKVAGVRMAGRRSLASGSVKCTFTASMDTPSGNTGTPATLISSKFDTVGLGLGVGRKGTGSCGASPTGPVL